MWTAGFSTDIDVAQVALLAILVAARLLRFFFVIVVLAARALARRVLSRREQILDFTLFLAAAGQIHLDERERAGSCLFFEGVQHVFGQFDLDVRLGDVCWDRNLRVRLRCGLVKGRIVRRLTAIMVSISSGTLRATFNNSLMATASIFGGVRVFHQVVTRAGRRLVPRISLLAGIHLDVVSILLRYSLLLGWSLLLRCPFVYVCLLRNCLIIAGTGIGDLLLAVMLFLGVRGVVYLERAQEVLLIQEQLIALEVVLESGRVQRPVRQPAALVHAVAHHHHCVDRALNN